MTALRHSSGAKLSKADSKWSKHRTKTTELSEASAFAGSAAMEAAEAMPPPIDFAAKQAAIGETRKDAGPGNRARRRTLVEPAPLVRISIADLD